MIPKHSAVAPWNDEQILNLVERQNNAPFHPYTCKEHGQYALIPTADGWVCSAIGCDYTQAWAYRLDANEWRWWDG